MIDITPLERIGLTKSEIAVYLALLKLGQTTASPIVEEARVTRSKIYDILERLKQKGLVSYILKGQVKYFSAADPHNLLSYLQEKEQEIKSEQKAIKDMMPQLLLRQHLAESQKVAEVFIGIKGMENAFRTLMREFDSQEMYYAFGAGTGENVKQVQLFFTRLHQQRVERGVRAKIIFNQSSRGLFGAQEKSRLVQVRYLLDSTPAAINIYKTYTIIAILNAEPLTFLINSQETADSFRKYFNVMWGLAKK